jgi:deoxyribodipyrimidine photo-lyase
MDGVIRDLMQEGYVHNHARMWFAAYVVHWLKVDWREAADWFENHLLDGDKASNHLSWQWVASAFSSRPYYFNKTSLARHTGEKYCTSCKVDCPFDQTYEALNEKLFKQAATDISKTPAKKPTLQQTLSIHQAVAVYAHDEMLSAAHPILRKSALNFFVFDSKVHAKWPLKRIQFVADCLNELPGMEIWVGDTATILNERGVGQLITQDTANLQIKASLSPFKVEWQPEFQFTKTKISEKRLKRFSRYWEKVGQEMFNGKIAGDNK